MNLDLFGALRAPRHRAGELFDGPATLAEELARLREAARRAERLARLRPGDEKAQRAAAKARRDYLALRDHRRDISADEVRASLVAEGKAAPLPPGNLDLLADAKAWRDDVETDCGDVER